MHYNNSKITTTEAFQRGNKKVETTVEAFQRGNKKVETTVSTSASMRHTDDSNLPLSCIDDGEELTGMITDSFYMAKIMSSQKGTDDGNLPLWQIDDGEELTGYLLQQ